ncbi:MAG: hypothetical protein B7Y78_09545, partial [Caulobacter sp. 35-67-4]
METVGSCAAGKRIIASVTRNIVSTDAAIDLIIVLAAPNDVVAITARERVRAEIAQDNVVTLVARKAIPPLAAYDPVLTLTAGFDISQTLISYSNLSTYGRAFWVGLLNTLLVAGLGIVFATVIGFVVGISRLSTNFLVSKAATGYVETIRNIPLLLQLLFWYNAVLKALPSLRESIVIPGGIFLNNRGLFLPAPIFKNGFLYVLIAFVIGVVISIGFSIWARRRQERTGEQAPVFLTTLALVIGLPVVVLFAAGFPLEFGYPEAGRFNITGGLEVVPEFAALLFGLSVYTAAFIAEVVRAGITSVSRGQTEAAYSLGLLPGPTLRMVVVPQAMRVII